MELAKTILPAGKLQELIKYVNKCRKEWLLGPNAPSVIQVDPKNPHQALTIQWQPIAKRFILHQGSDLWGYIDKEGNILYPSNRSKCGNIRDQTYNFIKEDGTIQK